MYHTNYMLKREELFPELQSKTVLIFYSSPFKHVRKTAILIFYKKIIFFRSRIRLGSDQKFSFLTNLWKLLAP